MRSWCSEWSSSVLDPGLRRGIDRDDMCQLSQCRHEPSARLACQGYRAAAAPIAFAGARPPTASRRAGVRWRRGRGRCHTVALRC